MDKLYENIKKRREALGMTQRELAEKSGYSDHTTITRMENGKVDVTIKRLKMIANALNTTPLELSGWNDDSTI